jgi:hypothetical protein
MYASGLTLPFRHVYILSNTIHLIPLNVLARRTQLVLYSSHRKGHTRTRLR